MLQGEELIKRKREEKARFQAIAWDQHVQWPDKFTCDECGANDTCDLAWDLYNTDGDCLAEK